MSQASYEKALKEWAQAWKKEHLSEDMVKLISQANYDLWYGPINDGAVGDPAEGDEELSKYPGFSTACKQIRDAVDDLPSDLYLDTETGEARTSEPEHEKCQTCDGEGTVGDDDPTHLRVRKDTCPDCNGRGGFEAAGDWWHVERSDIRRIIFGKELAEYI